MIMGIGNRDTNFLNQDDTKLQSVHEDSQSTHGKENEFSSSSWKIGSRDNWSFTGKTADLKIDTESEDAPKRMLSDSSVEATAPSTLSTLTNEAEVDDSDLFSPDKTSLQETLFNRYNGVEDLLKSACEVMAFDIVEVWLRTGPKTHQLINSHVRASGLEDSVKESLVDVYYGESSSVRVHRVSPTLCKRAKEADDIVWISSHTGDGEYLLNCALSKIKTAVAVPVFHAESNCTMTYIYFSLQRSNKCLSAVEFLVHMSLATAIASANSLHSNSVVRSLSSQRFLLEDTSLDRNKSHPSKEDLRRTIRNSNLCTATTAGAEEPDNMVTNSEGKEVLMWSDLRNMEYLTDGGYTWIHTAVWNGKTVAVKGLKPECQDLVTALNEMEAECDIHSKLDHPHIVPLHGVGTTSKGVRFHVMERLDGGTLSQVLGYDSRIRDRRGRFWKHKKLFTYLEVLTHARDLADALNYLHEEAFPGSMCLHRDLKPDNIGFTINGSIKLFDFGLARIVEGVIPNGDKTYQMSGETGSLRYMSPEVAQYHPYNNKADVYSYGIVLWELITRKKPYAGLSKAKFYEKVIQGGTRPVIPKKWPKELRALISECWSVDMKERPSFSEILPRLESLITEETVKGEKGRSKIMKLVQRHSTWF